MGQGGGQIIQPKARIIKRGLHPVLINGAQHGLKLLITATGHAFEADFAGDNERQTEFMVGTREHTNQRDRATKAHEADPTDLEALLSLGVSHTNELDAREAAVLTEVTGWWKANRGWLLDADDLDGSEKCLEKLATPLSEILSNFPLT